MRLEAAFADNPIHRPVENCAPDGNRTHVSQIALGVLSQLNYGTSHKASQSFALFCGCGSAPSAAYARLGKLRWASGVIERRHSMPGIEPGPPRLSPRTVRPPLWWRINDQLRPTEIGLPSRSSRIEHRKPAYALRATARQASLSASVRAKAGVTNRIRTGTNAFTGRDAAVTS